MDLDATRTAVEQLGLTHVAESLPQMLNEAVKDNLAAHRFLDKLLAAEVSQREERRIKTSLKLSGLPPGQTLGNFDFGFQPGVARSKIETLSTCAWIREHATLLVVGPPGVGKTHLAVALGVKAVENGFSVAFYRLEDLLHAMKQDADVPPRRLRGKKYLKVSLLIRLNVIPIFVPSLRERKDDIPLLASHFLQKFSQEKGKTVNGFLPEVTEIILAHAWPGNVRELENVVEHASIISKNERIMPRDLPRYLLQRPLSAEENISLRDHEKSVILKTLEETNWNKHQAAKKLRINRSSLYGKMKRYGLIRE